MTEHYLETGSIGWRHKGWEESYYPEDLPEDWQLEFYSHLFRVIALPGREWMSATADDMQQWLEDSGDNFEFFLVLDKSGDIQEQISQLRLAGSLLSERLLGIVVMQDQVQLTDSELNELSGCFRVFIDGESPVQDPALSACWRPGREITRTKVAILTPGQCEKPRQMREYIEVFLHQAEDERELYLLFEGEPPAIKAMQDAQVIAQMLTDV